MGTVLSANAQNSSQQGLQVQSAHICHRKRILQITACQEYPFTPSDLPFPGKILLYAPSAISPPSPHTTRIAFFHVCFPPFPLAYSSECSVKTKLEIDVLENRLQLQE